MTILQGTYKAHPKGFGFIESINTTEMDAVFVPPKLAKTLFTGDIVQFEATKNDDGKYAASMVNVVETPKRKLAGTIQIVDKSTMFVPELPTLPMFPVFVGSAVEVADADRVVANATLTPNGWAMTVLHNIGNISVPFSESKISELLYSIPTTELNTNVNVKPDTSTYTDLRDIHFVTIDGVNTTDVDDAVAVVEDESNYTLYVAIADVAAYVEESSTLDREAFERGTTVYFAQKIHPMLPRSISSGVASLTPEADKLALVVKMQIDKPTGEIRDVQIQESIIRSREKMNYDQVTQIVQLGQPDDTGIMIERLHRLYNRLLQKRIERGATPIRDGDYDFKLDENGKIQNVVHKPWHVAYGMVEECMLATNSSVGQWMADRNLLGIYRHHKGPDSAAWEDQQTYLKAIGLDIDENPTMLELANLTQQAQRIGESFGVENAIRASMRPATYEVHHLSHFSLAYGAYTHFTSPIRRYSDLTVHRIIKAHLNNKPNLSVEHLERIAKQCSICDQRAKKATREEIKRLRVQFAQKWKDQDVQLQLTGGNSAGWFLKNGALPLETFASMPSSAKMQWSWDSALNRAINIQDGTVLKLGDMLETRVGDVDTVRWRIKVTPQAWALQVSPNPLD